MLPQEVLGTLRGFDFVWYVELASIREREASQWSRSVGIEIQLAANPRECPKAVDRGLQSARFLKGAP